MFYISFDISFINALETPIALQNSELLSFFIVNIFCK